jgi:hypothetical protein
MHEFPSPESFGPVNKERAEAVAMARRKAEDDRQVETRLASREKEFVAADINIQNISSAGFLVASLLDELKEEKGIAYEMAESGANGLRLHIQGISSADYFRVIALLKDLKEENGIIYKVDQLRETRLWKK